MAEERYIEIPDDVPFLNPDTGKALMERVLVNPDEEPVEGVEPETITKDLIRSFKFFVTKYIVSHPIFSMKYGGLPAVRAGVKILDAINHATENVVGYMVVDADYSRMMKKVISKPPEDKKANETKLSAKDMVEMTAFESRVYFTFCEAIENASTEPPKSEAAAALPPPSEAQVDVQAEAN